MKTAPARTPHNHSRMPSNSDGPRKRRIEPTYKEQSLHNDMKTTRSELRTFCGQSSVVLAPASSKRSAKRLRRSWWRRRIQIHPSWHLTHPPSTGNARHRCLPLMKFCRRGQVKDDWSIRRPISQSASRRIDKQRVSTDFGAVAFMDVSKKRNRHAAIRNSIQQVRATDSFAV